MSGEEEYLWTCSLDKEKREIFWNPEDNVEGKGIVFIIYTL